MICNNHERVRLAHHRHKMVVDIPWPDGLRSRVRVLSQDKGTELKLRAQLAICDGSWGAMRAALLVKPDDKPTPGIFNAVVDEYYRSWVLTRNKSVASKKTFLSRFKKRFGRLPLRAFPLSHADAYIEWRKGAGIANSSINRELACLRHLLEWTVDREYLDKNPLARLQKLEEQEWAGPRPTEEIIRAVFAELDPRFVPVFTVIRETGARRGEVLSLEHWQVDRERRLITFAKRTKNGKTTIAPLTDEALNAIDSIPSLPGCPYVFYNPATGTRWYDARKRWEAARRAAGYPWLRVIDLRPAFGIKASEKGIPMHFIQSVLGHSSVAVTERYYAKFSPACAAKEVLRTLQGGRKA